jgi:hypothetical protein
MSITVGGRKFMHIGTMNGNVTSFRPRPSYRHESMGVTYHVSPTLSTQWILRLPNQHEGEIYDSLDDVVTAIDDYEREYPAT